MTLASLLQSFLSEYLEGRAPSSHPTFRTHAKKILELVGDREIATLTPSDIRAWVARSRITLAASSITHRMSFFRMALDWAIEQGHLTTNPVNAVKPPAVVNARYRYLSPDEETRLKLTARPEVFSVVRFAILTGLRRLEIFHIKGKHVDWQKRLLLVADSKTRAQRIVPLHPEAYAVLYFWQAVASDLGSEYLFMPQLPYEERWKAARYWCRAEFGSLVEECKIEDLHFHDLRHTFATRLVEAGVPIYEVQLLLGHKSPTMTQRYAHLGADHLRNAVYRLN